MSATFTDCPSCGRKLRLPEEALGKQVQCPSCQTTFLAQIQAIPFAQFAGHERGPAPTEARPSGGMQPPAARPESATPHLTLEEEGEPITLVPHLPSPPPPLRPVLLEAELGDDSGSPTAGLMKCPYCWEWIPKNAGYCRFCGEELDKGKHEWERRGAVRRDCDPHRGGLILTLGIVGLVASFLHILAIVGLPLSIAAWTMAQTDIKQINEGLMDPQGLSNTQAGRVCGIFGTVIGCLWVSLFCCVGFNVVMQ
jgi:LSD1 subclass zinc finger protein